TRSKRDWSSDVCSSDLRRLQNWLNNHSLINIPIDYFIVISFPSTIIKSCSPEHSIPEKIVHNHQLFFRIEALDKIYPVKVAGIRSEERRVGKECRSKM